MVLPSVTDTTRPYRAGSVVSTLMAAPPDAESVRRLISLIALTKLSFAMVSRSFVSPSGRSPPTALTTSSCVTLLVPEPSPISTAYRLPAGTVCACGKSKKVFPSFIVVLPPVSFITTADRPADQQRFSRTVCYEIILIRFQLRPHHTTDQHTLCIFQLCGQCVNLNL